MHHIPDHTQMYQIAYHGMLEMRRRDRREERGRAEGRGGSVCEQSTVVKKRSQEGQQKSKEVIKALIKEIQQESTGIDESQKRSTRVNKSQQWSTRSTTASGQAQCRSQTNQTMYNLKINKPKRVNKSSSRRTWIGSRRVKLGRSNDIQQEARRCTMRSDNC